MRITIVESLSDVGIPAAILFGSIVLLLRRVAKTVSFAEEVDSRKAVALGCLGSVVALSAA